MDFENFTAKIVGILLSKGLNWAMYVTVNCSLSRRATSSQRCDVWPEGQQGDVRRPFYAHVPAWHEGAATAIQGKTSHILCPAGLSSSQPSQVAHPHWGRSAWAAAGEHGSADEGLSQGCGAAGATRFVRPGLQLAWVQFCGVRHRASPGPSFRSLQRTHRTYCTKVLHRLARSCARSPTHPPNP